MKKPLKGAAAPVTALRSDSHQRGILGKLDALRRRELLCDITLVVEDVHFKAHKALLAASSDFFSLMFTGQDRDRDRDQDQDQASRSTYRLDGTEARAFAGVLEFIYSAQVSVQEGGAEQLLAAARRMQVADLVTVLLNQPAAGGGGRRTEAPQPSKRKRGRPRKIVVEHDGKSASGESARPVQDGEGGEVAAVAARGEETSGPGDEGDGADAQLTRARKRRIVPPLKYKAFKVGGDTAASKEPRRRGARRKYPDTEARCDDCGKVFKNHLFLKIHHRTHTGEKPFGCSICGKSFTQKHTLLVHQRIHTGEKPFVCSICSKALATKHTLKEHMNLHQEEKPFSCDRCDKSFTQKSQLKSHYRIHTGKLLPECAECHHKFLDTAQLKKHLRIHTGEKPFTCEICGKCFTAKSTLQTHIRIHRGEKPYDCSICSKTFSDASARRRHVASHSGRKPFTCSVCNLSFTRLDNLKTHTNTHNKERAAAAPEPARSAAAVPEDEEARDLIQLQTFQEQEIQLVVTTDVDNINFLQQGPNQEISIITEVEPPPPPPPSNQSVGVLDGPSAEQMHVITLSREAMEQLQAHHGPPQPLHLAHRPVPQLQLMHPPVLQEAGPAAAPPLPPPPPPHAQQAIHVGGQSGQQPISISQTSQQLSAHHIQGPTFQIQAGTLSYLYTTGLPHDG